jgi:hypothetical protein
VASGADIAMRWRELSVIGLAMMSLVTTGRASEFDHAWLRGSQVDETAPSSPILPPPRAYAPPRPYPLANPALRDPAIPAAALFSGITFEIGSRFWYASGKLSKDLFDDPRSSQNINSRLTYSGLTAGSFEAFGRAETPIGAFFKGFAGFGNLRSGALDDEDFPPGAVPYSSTLSQQHDGRLAYMTADLGQRIFTNARASLAVFAGYGFLNESTNAFGCSQIAGDPQICVPTITSDIKGITEDTNWQFVRVGFWGELKLLDRLKLSGEVAWLPFLQLSAHDTHWLRLGQTPLAISGPIPEFGGGTGFQAEALLSYQLDERFNFGLGWRYWLLETQGTTDFESVIVGVSDPVAQPLNFKTTRYGGFAQGSYRFGPL